jgi:hypothetical protein
MTHDWNTDELGRNNHARVSKMNEEFKKMGFKTWFDEERMDGQITQKMMMELTAPFASLYSSQRTTFPKQVERQERPR